MDVIIILSLFAIFLGGLVRTYFGFGEALISMPLLALIGLETHAAISVVGLAGLFVASLNIFSGYRNIKYNVLFLMLVGSLVGIPIGIWILRYFNTNIVQMMLGGFLIMYGTYSLCKFLFFNNRIRVVLKSNIWSGITGIVSGILGSLYNSHGVPVVIYGTLSRWHIKDFRSTIQAHFFLTAIFVVMGQGFGGIWTEQTMPLFLLSLPCLIISVIIGKYLSKLTSYNHFEKWLYVFIVILGALILIT